MTSFKMTEKQILNQKGWTKEEIQEAQSVLDRAKHHDVHFSKIVFWSALLVIILGNITVSLILLPFLIVFNSWILYSVVVIIALVMGSLYSFLIMDIGHLEKKHHILATIIIPIIAFSNLLVIVLISNTYMSELAITNTPHNQWIVSAVFVVAFAIPFTCHTIWKLAQKQRFISH
ncbi:MAG TPA: hypothetical protein VJI98_04455 [Candidatus Nanoarchaeia archaeon]|nr:hypothetical protein [Candidatus Nanoarchaeia archaeon]